ncbi:TIGR01459 family HAD-type hydrolase [Roseinatronobacter alkalisoli]|uniref:TIGR01459 family HAD-type hydrolase n=1 Tax=Roseinatronobacter alkalisoli TaxID=3028235 RepID=A0ABT5T9W4_9RHOB|nr:TIGR01459 family HAD-type hydrolase [Roseinatronobacter sp. HJB301]MDD7971766.1 TIGR01459 family HAD-type hydrolase [Roseinatronobacter sp. HJB301]
MTRLLTGFAQVAADYELALVDLWGCVHNGRSIHASAQAALCAFRENGGRVLLVTNAPRTAASVQARLDEMGLSRDAYDGIVTSGDATQEALLTGAVGRKVWHLGPAKDDDLFLNLPHWAAEHAPITRVGFDDAEGIVCTGPFDDMTDTPEDYRGRLLSAKVRGLKMLCANPDLVVDYGDTRIYCAGALAQLYTEMGGEALYFGKPHPPIYDLARRHAAQLGLKFSSDRVIAIGDGIHTDIQGGIAEGIDTLFVTGGLAAHEFGPNPATPDPDRLQEWLAAKELMPTFAIPYLG